MKIQPSHAFGAVLLAALLPITVRQTHVSGKITDDSASLWMILMHDVGISSDGWLFVLLIASAVGGTLLPFAPLQLKGRRFGAIVLAALGTITLIAVSGPLFRGAGIWVSYGPGVGFWAIAVLFLAAGILALRQKGDVKQ